MPITVPTISGQSLRMMSRKYGPTKVCQILVTIAGTITIASAARADRHREQAHRHRRQAKPDRALDEPGQQERTREQKRKESNMGRH